LAKVTTIVSPYSARSDFRISSSDVYSLIKLEFIAMRLALLVGLNVASVEVTRVRSIQKYLENE
jgi:hypothetical protein